MIMKPSSGINATNGNNSQENRKTTKTSLTSHPASSIYISKRIPKSNTTLLVKPPSIENDTNKRDQQHVNEYIQPSNSFFTTSISSFQSESLTSKYKLEITSEAIKQFSQQAPLSERRHRTQWITRHPSLHNKDKTSSTNSSVDLNTMSMSTVAKKELLDASNISVTEITTKDFDDEYQQYIEHGYKKHIIHNNLHKTIQSAAMNITTDDDDNNHDNDDYSKGLLSDHEKSRELVDQGIQAVLHESQLRKKVKSSSNHKKLKSATKRPKQTNATQITQQQNPITTTSMSPNRIVSQYEVSATTTINRLPSSLPRTEETMIGKNLITVDTSKARSNLEVVRMCIRELGWKECSFSTIADSDIFWHSSSFHEGNANFAFNSGRVNKFPGMNELLRKVNLTRSLNNMRLLFPNDFDFYPKTWFLPEHSQQFKDDVRYIHQQDKKHNRMLTTFIVKPSDGSQGEGIYLIRDPSHCIVTNRAHVVQEYIDRPLLINGLKFDLRIYVLILNLYPLEVFLYDEGLVRFATVNYKAPSTENLHQTFMHLTNYSLNKRSATYKHSTGNNQNDGSKRKLSSVWTQLIGIYGNERIERTKTLIIEMINKTILAILPELRVEYEFELPLAKKQNISCFQIVGFDIILTDHLKPMLLEVNANPSLRIDFDKEDESGKVAYQPSPIDEEIKKPLVLETLKLALPKKKLSTLTRHIQSQVNDELMAQRVEKVAQRRVEERNEKIKSANKNRFDLKLNPFFSRPSDSITREFLRLQQEQQEQVQSQKVFIPSPTQINDSFQSSPNQTFSTQLSVNSEQKSKYSPIKSMIKTKKSGDSTDDDESGTPIASVSDPNSTSPSSHIVSTPASSIRRSCVKSATSHLLTSADMTQAGTVKKLKLIFPDQYKVKYRYLSVLDKIAYIYIQLVVMLGHKTMTGGQFRSFANICGIINEVITAPSIDILYYQILRKWQQFVLRTNTQGLPFTAFVEAFFLLSQRKYPNSQSLIDGVRLLVNVCVRNLNTCLQAPSSPLIQQSNQYLLHRASRMNSSMNATTMNNRSTIAALRSSATNRLSIGSTSAPAARPHQIVTSATAVTTATTATTTMNNDDRTKQNSSKQSAKSVFPLFFDVL